MKLILFLVAFAAACSNPFRFVYTNTDSLAVEQDSLIKMYGRGQTVSKDTIRALRINWWVLCSEKTAPNNLVIRQFCLIDLFSGKDRYGYRIQRLVDVISGGPSPGRSWAEGYSYWKYSKEAIIPWLQKFPGSPAAGPISVMVRQIDSTFAATSYLRDGHRRPAPFGDLWDIPLDSAAQDVDMADSASCRNMTVRKHFGFRVYYISPMPLGFNGHCEDAASTRTIENGIPLNFKYYQGYHEKYHTEKAEWIDLLNPIRIFTIPFIW